jgi:hypothetical protein
MLAWLISHQPTVLFISEQTSHRQPASNTFLSNIPAPAISHPPNEQTESLAIGEEIDEEGKKHREKGRKGKCKKMNQRKREWCMTPPCL